jgi:hypothetical protein
MQTDSSRASRLLETAYAKVIEDLAAFAVPNETLLDFLEARYTEIRTSDGGNTPTPPKAVPTKAEMVTTSGFSPITICGSSVGRNL